MKVGINGLGRIGRLAVRAAFGVTRRPEIDPLKDNRLEIIHFNEINGDEATSAHLLEFDTVQGRWWGPKLSSDRSKTINIGRQNISYSNHKNPGDIPWGELGVDLVLECTGKFLTPETLEGHLQRGAKRVIVAAPVKFESVLNIVLGVNEDKYDRSKHKIVTAASCTTNCLAPVVKVIHEGLGIRHGQITTVHNPTNTNVVVDAPHKDLRRARSSMSSLQPTTTGSATAIGLIYPELKGKLNGHAVRVPVANASLTDCVFELEKKTSVGDVNKLFKSASENELAGILGYEEKPLVSADYAGDTRSSVVDAQSTLVTDGTLLKVYAWYDNEMAYSCRMIDLACYLSKAGL